MQESSPDQSPAPAADAPASTDAAPAATGRNKRVHERQHIGLGGATAFEHDTNEAPKAGLSCEVFDISRSGIGVRCRRMMYAGKGVFVRLAATADGACPAMLYGEVRYSRYAERGLYHIGIKFVPIPHTHVIKVWLEQQGSMRKRRS